MSLLLYLYVVISLVRSLGWLEQQIAEIGPLQFILSPVAIFSPAFKGMCGMCVNHTSSSAQHTTLLFIECRKSFGHCVGLW
jgi:hypothetical protein